MNIIELTKLLFYLSVIVWLLPPFRQSKGNYFIFFLILAYNDPVGIIYGFIMKSPLPSQISIFVNYLLLLSLIPINMIRKNWLVVVLFALALSSPTIFNFDRTQNLWIIILLHFFITLIILKNFITHYVLYNSISVFLTVFLFYEFTIILKISNFLIGFADATAFFYLTSIVQIFFGLYFSIFRENKQGKTV